MPLPEEYDLFDIEAHDEEAERLEQLALDHWLNDLRNLRSEAQASADAQSREDLLDDASDFRKARKEFESRHPRPSYKEPLRERAEWEWGLLEHFLKSDENTRALDRHRLSRGAFIETYIRRHEPFERPVDPIIPSPRVEPDRKPYEPTPWPPSEGDPVNAFREEEREYLDEWHELEQIELLKNPAYEAAHDIYLAATMGWFPSLEAEDREAASPIHRTLNNVHSKIQRGHDAEYRPGTIGDKLHTTFRALEMAEDARELLDAAASYPWMTEAAHRVLMDLLTRAIDLTVDHYGYLRSLYDGYKERAERILTRGEIPPPMPGEIW